MYFIRASLKLACFETEEYDCVQVLLRLVGRCGNLRVDSFDKALAPKAAEGTNKTVWSSSVG
jgi:hypothetical protein